jgi:hypothetical protein
MTSQSRVGSSTATVRAAGNLALSVCGMLLLLDVLDPKRQVELALVILVIAGVGLRIEAAIRDRTTGD